MPRRVYLDWLRGFAVVIMIFWHAMDAWTAPASRAGPPFSLIVMIGGWAAPLFLFLAGISVALSGAAQLARGAGRRRAVARELEKRGWQIVLLALVFRLQSFLLNPRASWMSMLKPDILNILGVSIVAAAFAWGRATSPGRRMAWLVAPAGAIVLLTPWVRTWQWPAILAAIAPPLEGYIRPVPGVGGFSIFPWAAFVFAGADVGSRIVAPRPASREPAFHAGLGFAGLGVALAGYVGSFLPSPFAESSFWTTSLSFFLIRLGVMIAGITAAWFWLQRPGGSHWSPMVIFGRTSLFVYWVHVELAYGFASYPLHSRLPLPWALAAFVGLTGLMLVAARRWMRRQQPLVPQYLTP
jgi:uncharacterized membrane protein